jgi:uncharacterized membrane protein
MLNFREQFLHWRSNFLAGLAVVLPAIISVAIVRWLFGTVSNVTDLLLFFLPRAWTHARNGEGEMYWYWSLLALLLGILLVTLAGRAARNYLGRKLIQLMDELMSRVPLLNKIYGVVKQVNEAFSTSKKSAFKQVVLLEYPRAGSYSIGFITSDDYAEASARLGQHMVGIFIPTTPNPTSGFLLVVPAHQLVRLNMSVAEGIKYIISLGAVTPEYRPDRELPALDLPPTKSPAPTA